MRKVGAMCTGQFVPAICRALDSACDIVGADASTNQNMLLHGTTTQGILLLIPNIMVYSMLQRILARTYFRTGPAVESSGGTVACARPGDAAFRARVVRARVRLFLGIPRF